MSIHYGTTPRRLVTQGRCFAASLTIVVSITAGAGGGELGLDAAASQAGSTGSAEKFLTRTSAIPGQYIVALRATEVSALRVETVADELVARAGGSRGHVYQNALRGFAAQLPERAARALSQDARVAFVEEDSTAFANAVQSNPPSWGLDRIDARPFVLDSTYEYNADGTGVNAYVIDTGVLTTHVEFTGRITVGFNARAKYGETYQDCNGHGTHVAGILGGTTVGVAKKVKLFSVKVLDCSGSGATSDVIAGIDWVAAHHKKPAVANMSIGWGATDPSVETAIQGLVDAGVTFAVAAGNDSVDACQFSPGSSTSALVVGATAHGWPDQRTSFSNFGTCLDLYAPGEDIYSSYADGNNSYLYNSGTSMASPHVAGAAALYLQNNRTALPAQVSQAVIDTASRVTIQNAGAGSPNLMLHTRPFGATPPGFVLNAIGTVKEPGRSSYARGVSTLNAGGTAVGRTADDFDFAYRHVSGDTEQVANLTSLNSNGASWSAAGVMIRETTARNAKFASVLILSDGRAQFRRRTSTGGTAVSEGPTSGYSAPRWVKIRRAGSAFTAYVSSDGETWSVIGTTDVSISMGPTVLAGVLAFRANSSTLAQATFATIVPWADSDVGEVATTGSASLNRGTFTQLGAGTGVYANADAFNFDQQAWVGDGQFVAQVASLAKPADATDALAGLMFRDGIAADAREVSMLIFASGKVRFRYRSAVGGRTSTYGPSSGAVVPQWIKLERLGATFTGYLSTDGVSWTAVGGTTLALPAQLQVGMVVAKEGGTATATGTFNSVTLR